MTKSEELKQPNSCFNRAQDGEPIFVLLGRDVSAPEAIRAWVRHRVETATNTMDCIKMLDALRVATEMEIYRNSKLQTALADAQDYQQLFELQHRRMGRAIQVWRDAHPGNELVQPDLGDLLGWLLDERENLRRPK